MKCKEILKYASDYLDSSLPRSLVELIEEHLGECEVCKKQVSDLKATVSKLGMLKHQAKTLDCWPEIKVKLNNQNVSNSFTFYRSFAFSLAAAILILITVFIMRPKPQADNIVYTAQTQVNPYYAAHSAFQQSNPISGSDVVFIDADMNNYVQSGALIRK